MPKKYAQYNLPNPYPVWTTTSLPNATGFTGYNQSVTATSPTGATPIYSLVGTLPPGLSLSSAGAITGQASNPASADTTYSFAIRATTGSFYTDKAFSITVTYVTPADPYASNVVFLYHLDGNYTDVAQGRGMSVVNSNANSGLTTTNPKFGTGALVFTSSMTGSQDIRIVASSDLVCTGDFTFEYWMYANSVQGGAASNPVPLGVATVAQGSSSATNSAVGPATYFTRSSGVYAVNWKNTTVGTYTGNLLDSTWHHYAFVRSGSTISHYLDGVKAFDLNVPGTLDFGSQFGLRLGQWNSNGSANYFTGNIDELRLTKVARYTGNFTPPTQAFAYP